MCVQYTKHANMISFSDFAIYSRSTCLSERHFLFGILRTTSLRNSKYKYCHYEDLFAGKHRLKEKK